MKKYKVLYHHFGQNSDTSFSPVHEYNPVTDDPILHKKEARCINWDDDGLIEMEVNAIREVSIPDWLPVESWIYDHVKWMFVWSAGVNQEWPESWQRELFNMGEVERFACVKLLKTKTFRSEFRFSLKQRLVEWMETKPEDRIYKNSPFSDRQWSALIKKYDVKNARRNASNTYYNTR